MVINTVFELKLSLSNLKLHLSTLNSIQIQSTIFRLFVHNNILYTCTISYHHVNGVVLLVVVVVVVDDDDDDDDDDFRHDET